MRNGYDVLIVGGGHGGAQAAIALRQNDFRGTIAIVSDEPELPYERPPLSKEYLSGEKPFERLLIRPAQFWTDRDIAMLLGRHVVSIDPIAHRVTTGCGMTIEYGRLIWAAGGSPRRLSCSGHHLAGINAVRTRADVDAMLAGLDDVGRVVVIGGGYIGLEAAAVLAKLGKQVMIVEALSHVLARVAGAPVSRFYEAEHRARGVEIRLNASVTSLEGDANRVRAIRLANDEVVACDMVVVGIGIVPSVAPLLAAGAAGGDGVDVDEQCRTTLPDIYAIGDCAAHHNAFADGARIRLESVQNASDQAVVAASTITGRAKPYHAVPWFWSNQYDLRLQTVGLSAGHDQIIVRGDPARRTFSAIYLKQGRVVALDCVNSVKDYVQGRDLVTSGATPSLDRLADTAFPLKNAQGPGPVQ